MCQCSFGFKKDLKKILSVKNKNKNNYEKTNKQTNKKQNKNKNKTTIWKRMVIENDYVIVKAWLKLFLCEKVS